MQQASLSLPEFSNIDITSIEAQLAALLSANRQHVQQLVRLNAPTWQNFAQPVQAMDMAIADFWAPVSHLNAVQNSDALRDVYQRCIAMLTEYSSELGQNEELYKAYKALEESADFKTYNSAQQQWIKKALRDFHLSGVDLEPAKKQRFKDIKARLADLSQTFSNHVLDATAAWQKHILDKTELQGLPESSLAMLQQIAKSKSLEGYVITLDGPVYQAVMMYADDRSLRQELYMAYMTKASDQGPNAGQFDNSQIMVETLRLRQEIAALLGFACYSERSLFTKMADTVEEVIHFLNDLAEKSVPFARREVAELNRYGREKFGLDAIASWDFAYVSEKYRQEHFSLSDEILREYFPLETVLSGLFTIVGKLFGITISADLDFDSYHPDVRLYNVQKDGEHIASFYFDLFAREKKRGGAWMADCRSRWQKTPETQEIPVAFLTCNFRPSTQDQPALLGHGEVTTLFHEFGHGLHHMLTTQTIAGISGISGVEWDAVELPSQFLENWCWEEESIRLISAHFKTGEPLPHELLGSMLAAKNFNAGITMTRQLEFALFDMAIHSDVTIDKAEKIQAHLDAVREKTAVITPPREVRFQHAFGHIFAGGYAAGYYSYKWAEVLSADAFSLFEEKGLFDQFSGECFLKNILQVGSSRPAAESFAAFRGREPDVQPLLRHSGLTGELA
jgi:oligopeptidase A